MRIRRYPGLILVICCASLLATAKAASAAPFFFSTGNVDGRMASATRPDSGAAFEIETADDFLLTGTTQIDSASFTGLLVGGGLADISQIVVEIYQVFPLDSDVNRTSGAPNFSTPEVPTRVNSPSDVELDGRDSASNELTFTGSSIANTFTAANSLQPGGIHPFPGQTTGGNGQLTGQEVQFDVTFTSPFLLTPGHYFFVPQVLLSNGGNFYWLSSVRPIVAPGTPFNPDLQAWARDAMLDPDWLRIGTDIVGGTTPPTFNMAFTLNGTVPEPGTMALIGVGLAAAVRRGFLRKRTNRG